MLVVSITIRRTRTEGWKCVHEVVSLLDDIERGKHGHLEYGKGRLTWLTLVVLFFLLGLHIYAWRRLCLFVSCPELAFIAMYFK